MWKTLKITFEDIEDEHICDLIRTFDKSGFLPNWKDDIKCQVSGTVSGDEDEEVVDNVHIYADDAPEVDLVPYMTSKSVELACSELLSVYARYKKDDDEFPAAIMF